MVRTFIYCILFWFGFITSFSYADQVTGYQKDFVSSGLVIVRNDRGSVAVTGWDETRISVKAESGGGSLDSFIFNVETSEALIEVPVEKGKKLGQPTNLVIMIPSGSRLRVQGVSSDINIASIRGDVSVKTVSGDLSVSDLLASLFIETVDADTKLHRIQGDVSYESISGDLRGDISSQSVQLKTVSGNIDLSFQEGGAAMISSVSGDVSLAGGFVGYPDVSIKTVSGNIHLQLSGAVDTQLKISAITNTDVRVNLPQSGLADLSLTAKQFSHNIGNGVGRILLSTVQGDISVNER
ncbi:DUF4097 family beta strand repeat-containing protein [Gynuella sunshinyii]|uniref:DUF4097 domain-containing protein n=1 Tax=Gynuella sunshinyii YC6258 TaxID=1445510 RepID=A0A0C5VXV6_9GAMM|nr:DUF4097 family beta strand repeat-containing protein [Gynuella sunshinyii]AJQ95214.1 hypothetical protein YC6258_03178 [Gynuella sunshinyii YC6258]